MKVQIYFGLHLCLLLCIPVHSYTSISDEDIYRNMHVRQKLCGSVIPNTMRELCLQYNGYRAKRSITLECCKQGCTFHYLMTHFCKVPRVKLDELPSLLASTTTENYKNADPSQHLSQNNGSEQVRVKQKFTRESKIKSRREKHLGKHKKHKKHFKCRCIPRKRKVPLPNKIERQGQPASVEIKHKPAEYGYVSSTRPPIIYSHSYTKDRGSMNYSSLFPNKSNNNQQ